MRSCDAETMPPAAATTMSVSSRTTLSLLFTTQHIRRIKHLNTYLIAVPGNPFSREIVNKGAAFFLTRLIGGTSTEDSRHPFHGLAL